MFYHIDEYKQKIHNQAQTSRNLGKQMSKHQNNSIIYLKKHTHIHVKIELSIYITIWKTEFELI
jgi:hypothetical protein